MAKTDPVTVLEYCLAPPPPETVSEMSLPLTFCDTMMIDSMPVKSLFFYAHPVSKDYFRETIIPGLKNSLSLSLGHFLLLACKLIIPSSDSREKPEFRYADGNSVPIVFAESNSGDFNHLTGDHPRNCCEFYSLAPDRASPSSDASGSSAMPLLALQVTLFPENGICVGVNAHHVAVDASSIVGFLKAWAYLSQLPESAAELPYELAALCDRTLMKEKDEVGDIVWDQMKKWRRKAVSSDHAQDHAPINPELVQAKFVLGQPEVQRLKNNILRQQPSPKHLSTFTVVCAYLWTCILKSHDDDANHGDTASEDDDLELLGFSADGRGRSCPAIPVNYFGNCLAICKATAKYRQLTGERGFLIAAESIGEAIHERLHNEEGIFEGAETWYSDSLTSNFKRFVGISGTPKFDLYSVDFGWGKPKTFDMAWQHESGIVTIGRGREPGDVEIGLCLSRKRMEAFTVIFREGLNAL